MQELSEDDRRSPIQFGIRRRSLNQAIVWLATTIIIIGVFFLGQFLVKSNIIPKFFPNAIAENPTHEVFGFAPFWSLSKMGNVDFSTLTTFAYFSLPVLSDGTVDSNSFEWQRFQSDQLASLFARAKQNNVRRVVTFTQMDAGAISAFLENPEAWKQFADESVKILAEKQLDGVNIDFEYVVKNDYLKSRFSEFIDSYTSQLKQNLNNPYITVSVLASSARFDKIYDVSHLAKVTDGIFMMAYDFYYPGSEVAGPSAPLYGYNNGRGPFWYDVSTAVSDFLKVAPADKIIMGVPYYGWDYSTYDPRPKAARTYNDVTFATTNESAAKNKLFTTTPIGGWDPAAHVSWRGYWDGAGWHVVYIEDTKSLSEKYDFIKKNKLAGVGIWALGFDSGDETLWKLIRQDFPIAK